MAERAGDGPAGAGRLVVVVEDSAAIAGLLVGVLEDEGGCRAVAAGDGAAALELLAGVAADLVVLDVHLPGVDGLAVREHMRRDPRLRDIPVVFVTSDPAALARLRAAGETALEKPVALDALLAAVARALGDA